MDDLRNEVDKLLRLADGMKFGNRYRDKDAEILRLTTLSIKRIRKTLEDYVETTTENG